MALPNTLKSLKERKQTNSYRKAKYIKWHNNYDDVLTLDNEYDIHGEKDEWLYIQDDRGSYQYYRKNCFEILN